MHCMRQKRGIQWTLEAYVVYLDFIYWSIYLVSLFVISALLGITIIMLSSHFFDYLSSMFINVFSVSAMDLVWISNANSGLRANS